jgi:hypothetical protein
MSDPGAVYPIQITADDKTARGAKAAEKRLGQIPKHVSAVNRRWAAEADRSTMRATRGVLRTFAQVEQAGARAFGGRSMTSGLTSRVGALREATSALGTGMGEAATSGGLLSSAITTVGVAAAGTIGIVAAAGYAAFKLADGWAQGAASIGRTAQTIGVASKALQEFTAAGERAGVDKGASTSALGGIAQTFNDARYGRNQEAMALMMRLGIKPRNGADGQLDTIGMTQDLADALAHQKNAQTRRMIASRFGISDAALPMFTGGGAALRADMKDADGTALVLSDEEIAKGKRIARKGAIVGQMKDRALGVAGSAAADVAERGYDVAIDGGRSALAGGRGGVAAFTSAVTKTFAPAAETIGHAATKIEGAGEKLLLAVRSFFEGKGWTRAQASGIAASLQQESGFNPKAIGDSGRAFGVGQWHADRQRNFAKVFGHDIRSATREEQLQFVDWELRHTEGRAGRMLASSSGGYAAGDAVSRYYERPANREGEARRRGAEAQRIENIHEIHVHPDKVTVKSRTRGSPSVAISHAPVGS